MNVRQLEKASPGKCWVGPGTTSLNCSSWNPSLTGLWIEDTLGSTEKSLFFQRIFIECNRETAFQGLGALQAERLPFGTSAVSRNGRYREIARTWVLKRYTMKAAQTRQPGT